jgi:CRP/FNR family transcriptional regulator
MLKASVTAEARHDAFEQRAFANCADCAIRNHAVCSQCSREELGRLAEIKTFRSFGAGDAIMSMGERAPFLGTVMEGIASMSRLLPDGRRQVVALLFPGDFIGRPFSPVAPFDYVSVTGTRLCVFPRPKFEEAVRSTPALEHRMLEMALDELDAAREWMVLLGRKTAQEKL